MSEPPHKSLAWEREQAGDVDGAVEIYRQVGDLREAARTLWRAGRKAESGQVSAEAGLHYEAAICFIDASEPEQALHHLVRVATSDERYRDAALRAILVAEGMGKLDLRLDTFLAPFLEDAPRTQDEKVALGRLAILYRQEGFADEANRYDELAGYPTPEAGIDTRNLNLSDERAVLEEERAFRNRSKREPSSPGVAAASVMSPGGAVGAPLQVGSVVAGRYQLTREIGRGGMAVVFEAEDTELGEPCAIKVLKQVVEDVDDEARFKREVSVSRRLSHPNIVRVYDIGRVSGFKFITMELLSGRDLDDILLDEGKLELDLGLDYAKQMCAGLGYAHGETVFHRDIKPANFFVTDSGALKLMDFGIAKEHRAARVTQTGVIMGTPEFIAPEQIQNHEQADHRADLYALGVTFFQMFTGQLPFFSEDMIQLLMLHMSEPPPSPRTINREVPIPLEAVILRLLQKEPNARYDDCDGVLTDLNRISLRDR